MDHNNTISSTSTATEFCRAYINMERLQNDVSDDTDDTEINDDSVDIVSTNCNERHISDNNKFSIDNILGIGRGKDMCVGKDGSRDIQKCLVTKVKCLKPTAIPASRNTGLLYQSILDLHKFDSAEPLPLDAEVHEYGPPKISPSVSSDSSFVHYHLQQAVSQPPLHYTSWLGTQEAKSTSHIFGLQGNNYSV
ncbi:unnamed protein product [Diabrotica balteata]|uniref:Uncharacterized protein n=1 Tax=Diabrotica balteata TaxID=107213 RepID=A0A9N9XEN1_DIABA|nr:unnamed protein product [Diabrotica balteata]